MNLKDAAIIRSLALNSKITNAQLAKDIGLSESATLERVRRLEQQGVIQGYTINIDAHSTDRTLEVFMAITMERQSSEDVRAMVQRIQSLDEVLSCAQVLGRFDFIAHVAIKDTEALQQLINNKLMPIANIRRVESLTVVDTVKQFTPPIPLAD